jgi:Asp-tRNA(Asn)/Glu-tRNA(Gln) amidotransferase A subunit family amidase
MIAPRLEEEKLLKIAHTYEEHAWWRDKMTPPGYED